MPLENNTNQNVISKITCTKMLLLVKKRNTADLSHFLLVYVLLINM